MVEVTQYDGPDMQVMGFLGQVTDLPKLKPGELANTDRWLAEKDGEPVGMVVIDQDSHLVRRIGILDEYQGKGIGSELIGQIETEYGSPNARVDKDNEQAQGFFEARGWEKTGDRGELIEYEF